VGYHTMFSITTEPVESLAIVQADIERISERECFDGQWHKWYVWRDDVLTVSKLHPLVTITIHGIGEHSERDEWVARYIDGSITMLRLAHRSACIVDDGVTFLISGKEWTRELGEYP